MADKPQRSYEVFISYSTKDKQWADAACAVLEQHRVRCWIAPRDITPGTEWGAAIIAAIDSCQVMVLIFSAHANESAQVRREVERAISKGLAVLPCRVEDVRPAGAMEYALSNTHWLDAFSPPVERQMELLAESVKTLLRKDRTAGVKPARKPPPAPPRPASRRGWLLGAGAALVLLLGLAGLWAGGVFRGKAKEGVLAIEASEPNPEVFVDGEKVAAAWGEGGRRAEVRVRPGTHKVEVRKDGFAAYGEEVTLEGGGSRILAATLARSPAGAGEPPPGGADGFVPLFNGKDRDGWKTHPRQRGHWRVDKGVLVGSGTAASHLYTNRGDYRDFHLRVEARVNDGGNSGVIFRAPFGPCLPAHNPTWPLGYEAQINSTHGDPNKTGSLYAMGEGAVVSVPESPVPPGEWFTLEVIAEGDHLVIKVNGKTTADYHDAKHRFTSGHIALQQHNPQTVAEFRKIEIKELPPAGRPVIPRFPAVIWSKDRGKWRVVDDYLEQTSADPNVNILFGDSSWTDYDFFAEAMLVRGNDQCALMFRSARAGKSRNFGLFGLGSYRNTCHTLEGWTDGKMYPVKGPLKAGGRLAPGVWNRLAVRVRGNRVECFLNGKRLFDVKYDKNPAGCVGLRTWGSVYRFRNIKVKAPDGKVLLEGLPDL